MFIMLNIVFNPLLHRDAFGNRVDPDQGALVRAT